MQRPPRARSSGSGLRALECQGNPAQCEVLWVVVQFQDRSRRRAVHGSPASRSIPTSGSTGTGYLLRSACADVENPALARLHYRFPGVKRGSGRGFRGDADLHLFGIRQHNPRQPPENRRACIDLLPRGCSASVLRVDLELRLSPVVLHVEQVDVEPDPHIYGPVVELSVPLIFIRHATERGLVLRPLRVTRRLLAWARQLLPVSRLAARQGTASTMDIQRMDNAGRTADIDVDASQDAPAPPDPGRG